ncbi:renin-like [Eschrichtius robustus]|uniref:renin-like n=1 Tax=Eschrichtius robustus TaxID=9764 RepID=UPI0035C10431
MPSVWKSRKEQGGTNVARLCAKWSQFTKRLSFGNGNGSAVLINHLDAQLLTSSPSPFSLGPKTFFPARETPESLSPSAHHERRQGESAVCNPEEGPHRNQPCWHPDLSLPASRTVHPTSCFPPIKSSSLSAACGDTQDLWASLQPGGVSDPHPGQQALGEPLSALSRDETCSKLLDLEIRYEQETRGHWSNTASDSEDGEEGEGPEKSQRKCKQGDEPQVVLTHQYSLTAWPVTQALPLLCSPGVPAPPEATQTQGVEDCRQVPSLRDRSSHLRGRANTLTGADNVLQERPLSGREEGWLGTLEGDKLLHTDDMLDQWFSNLAACSCPLGSF